MSGAERTPGTKAVHAGLPPAEELQPFLPGPVFAAPVHLAGEAHPAGYGRFTNPTWERYEAALAELEGGEVTVFASGMAAVTAVLLTHLEAGDVLVAPHDGYPGVRDVAAKHLPGVEVRLVATDEAEIRGALDGATLVWVETPSNPGLAVVDLRALAPGVRAAGATLVVDNTLLTPLLQRPLELGADLVVASGTKALTGHSDVLIGHVATRTGMARDLVRGWRTLTGSIPGPMEVWLAHRSLATLDVRLERQQRTAAALAEALRARDDVADVRWPGVGGVLGFTLADGPSVDRFLAAATIVADATSFGGVHTSAERRTRWGTDAVADGWVRFSCGIETTEDVVADVLGALDAAAR